MIAFLHKISELNPVQDVLLLSAERRLLYGVWQGNEKVIGEKLSLIRLMAQEFDESNQVDLLFAGGCWLLFRLPIGLLVISMREHHILNQVRSACENLKNKLLDRKVCRKVLVRLAEEVDDPYRAAVLKELEAHAEGEVAQKIAGLLCRSYSAEHADDILSAACHVLGGSKSEQALHALHRLLDDSEQGKKLSADVLNAARVARMRLQLDLGQTEVLDEPKNTDTSPGIPGRDKAGAVTAARFSGKDPEGIKIAKLVNDGDTSTAVRHLLSLIEKRAGEMRFREAEELREWLMEIDSMAIREIIQAAELIEEAKKASISSDLLRVWNKLVTTLGQEEFSALYYVSRQQKFGPGEDIVRPGAFLSSLFFLNKGQVEIFGCSGGRDVVIRVACAGEILGSESFFEVSVWTVGLRSLGAEVSVLDWPGLLSFKHSYPALQAKLLAHCTAMENPNAMFAKGRRSRRKHERKQIRGKTFITLLHEQRDTTETTARGDLLDISLGGVAFGVRFSRKKNAVVFLGKTIRAVLQPDGVQQGIQRTGKVMAVHCNDFVGNDYSLHVEFDQELTPAEIHRLLSGSM